MRYQEPQQRLALAMSVLPAASPTCTAGPTQPRRDPTATLPLRPTTCRGLVLCPRTPGPHPAARLAIVFGYSLCGSPRPDTDIGRSVPPAMHA